MNTVGDMVRWRSAHRVWQEKAPINEGLIIAKIEPGQTPISAYPALSVVRSGLHFLPDKPLEEVRYLVRKIGEPPCEWFALPEAEIDSALDLSTGEFTKTGDRNMTNHKKIIRDMAANEGREATTLPSEGKPVESHQCLPW